MAQTIKFDNIKVEGIPFEELLDIKIHNEMNAYGWATVVGNVAKESARSFASGMGAGNLIKITTTASGQPGILFIGVVANTNVVNGDSVSTLTLHLKATASNLDNSRENHTYQKLSATYEEVTTKALNGKADLEMNVSDKATGQLIMQYNETPWTFAKRMASSLGASICANVTSRKPVLTVGIPRGGKSYNIETVNYSSTANGTSITCYQYCEIGDKVTFNGGGGTVTSIDATLESAVIRVTLGLGASDNFKQEPISNPSVSGRMMKGVVQAVKLDKVQVHFVDIDASYSEGGDLWLPYSTAYSSSDGSGFYCMPQEGDEVRVFMPSDNEKDAFAASSVNTSPLDNPKDKKWKSPAGKEILMTDGGIFITCKDQKIFINLEDENGVSIVSDSDINVMTMNNMLLYAQKEIKVQAENKILISTGTSYIDMVPGEIQLAAEKVTIK